MVLNLPTFTVWMHGVEELSRRSHKLSYIDTRLGRGNYEDSTPYLTPLTAEENVITEEQFL